MKVVGTIVGRVILQLNHDEVMPLEGTYAPDFVERITKRYSFVSSPNSVVPWRQVMEDGLKFEMGKLGDDVILDLTVYDNGVVVSAHTTETSEAILDDFLQWSTESLQYRISESVYKRPKFFLSEFNAELNASINEAVTKLDVLSDAIGQTLKQTYSTDFPKIGASILRFNYDRTLSPAKFQQLAAFHIERRTNHSYEDNVYWCQAPLRTADHIKMLELFERILDPDDGWK